MSTTSNYLYKLLDTIAVRDSLVGIGTEYPQGPFHVHGPAFFDQITSTTQNINLRTTSLSNIGSIYVNEHALIGGTLTASNLRIIGESTVLNTTTSNTDQLIITNLGTGPALRVTQGGIGSQFSIAEFIDAETHLALKIADTGLVGINTGTPTERVHVYDTSNVSVLIQSGTSNLSQLRLQNAAGEFYIGPSDTNTVDVLSTAQQPLRIGTNSNAVIHVTPLGNVGIGSTQPVYQLDVGSLGVRDIFAIRNSGAHRYTHGYGGVQYTTTGAHSIGLRISWTNPTASHIYTFRIAGKFHITSDAPSMAFRRFESLVTPADDEANQRPSQVSVPDLIDFSNGDFRSITHTVTRHAANSVNLVVTWNALVSPAMAYLDLDMMAHEALGDFHFEPISSSV